MFALSDGQPAPAHPDAVVTGPGFRFTVLTSRLIRMEWDEAERFVDERTQLVVSREFELPHFTLTHQGDGVEIVTDHLHLRYAGGPFTAATLSVTLIQGARDPHYATWRYGEDYPQRLPLRGNLLGTTRTLDEVDGATPLDPGILSTYGFALVDDSDSVLLTADGWVGPRPGAAPGAAGATTAPARDLYLFGHGADFRGALADFHHLTGPTPLVPRYTLGNWWSRYWPYSEAEYLSLMDRFEAEQIPLSVAVIDMDWHVTDVDPAIGTGWTGYSWNRSLFPDPRRFLAALHERGLAVTLNVHPADGVRRHEDRYPEMARAMGIDPSTGEAIAFDVTSREFVDAYLRVLHHPLEDDGVDFWWLDWQSGGRTRIAGLDPLWMLNHLHFVDSGREREGGDRRRPLTFSRYAGLGSHRYPVGFSGDTIITWPSLDFQPYFTATAANVGYTWWSHDIGGHMFGARDVELAVRWLQLGVFSPINRMHSSNSPFTSKEPWSFGPRAHAIIARFLRLRHALVPMLYTAAWAAHAEHVAIVRPMYHDYPDTPDAYRVANQAMLGEHVLLAPITGPAERSSGLGTVRAWLPEGSWFDLFTGQRYDGGRTVVLHRPLERYPVLVRAGAVLALQGEVLADVAARPDVLALRVIPGAGVSTLSEDDGAASPGLESRQVTVFRQALAVREDGGCDLELVIEPTTGTDPLRDRGLVVEVAGVAGVDYAEVSVGGEAGRAVGPAEVVQGELLAPALRLDLGRVDLTRGLVLRLWGTRAAALAISERAFELLDAAEIAFHAKEEAWAAVSRLDGLALAQELATIELPGVLRDALIEVAAARPAW